MGPSGIIVVLFVVYLVVADGSPCCQSCCACCSGCGGGCDGGSMRQADPYAGQASAKFEQVMRKVIGKMEKNKTVKPSENAIPDYVEQPADSEVRAAKPGAAKPAAANKPFDGVGPIRYENDPGDPPPKMDPPPMAPSVGKVVEPVYWLD